MGPISEPGSPALSMKTAPLLSGTTEKPAGERGVRHQLSALDHRKCGRTLSRQRFRSFGGQRSGFFVPERRCDRLTLCLVPGNTIV
jgi:hypothetical protein